MNHMARVAQKAEGPAQAASPAAGRTGGQP